MLFASCNVEEPIDASDIHGGKTVTIRVSMPEEPFTKVDFTDTGSGLHLAWGEANTETIRVISGSNSSVFTLTNWISDHEAEFTGVAPAGSSFDILYPGTYASVEEAEADVTTPTQTGNGSTAHLRYKALLSGVDSYANIAFKSDWASAHGGTLKQAAAVKIVARIPDGATALKKVGIGLGGKNYSLPLESITGTNLTAYMMVGWDNIELADGSSVPVYVMAGDNEVYSRTLTIGGGAKTIQQGKMNSFGGNTPIDNLTKQDFVSGNGTAANPYLIANARQLNNMHNVMVNNSSNSFRLLEDIDASTLANWVPLNNAGTFDKRIIFDGAGYTISGLKSSGTTYASFAGVLYGEISNVTFSGATINASSKSGVVAGFLGTTSNDYARVATCTNVIVKDSEVTSSAAAGGFAGHVRGKGAVTGCKVINTTVNGTNILGGFAGLADISGVDKYEVPAIFTACEVDGVTVNQNSTTASAKFYTGGFIGETYQAHSFINCKVKGTTVDATKAAINNIGGFVGYTDYAGANFQNCTVDNASSVTAKGSNIGGFVGYANIPDAYSSCSTAATVTNTAEYTGGFAGYAAGASNFNKCFATGNITGSKHVGGFVGTAFNASFTGCYYKNGTVEDGVSGQAQSAGFCAYAKTGVSFDGCYVLGATVVANSGQRIGGFIGQLGDNSTKGNTNISINQCYVDNTSITGATNTGGFVGVQYDNICSSWVSGGTVTAKGNNCGGFSGFIDTANLTNCYSTASVVGSTYSTIGGMIGIQNKSDASFCYAAGSVTGSGSNVGGFVGSMALATSSIDHCIGWSSLTFYGNKHADATTTDIYAGTSGTVSSHASALSWPAAIWNLEGGQPVLIDSPHRINAIFVGDSITWQWARNEAEYSKSKYPLKIPFNSAYMTDNGTTVTVKFHPGFFAGNGYIDKGISGQNTTQMLSRFQKDVIDLNPKVVVIMGGTNDLAQGVTKETIVANIAAMAEMADAAGIKVVLCSVTPNNDNYSKLSPKNKGGHIITLNGMIQTYATSKSFTYCDYWSSLVAGAGETSTSADVGYGLKDAYRLYDNLHPGPDGYDVMEPIIKTIINSLL